MKIKYSALVSDARGKLNGSVASKNRYGSYLRNKITPVNPQTTAQMEARQRFGSLSSAWGGLTIGQRNSWNNATKDFPFTDIFGDIKHLSGNSLFVKLNSNLEKVGSPIIEVAPQVQGLSTLPAFDVDMTVVAGEITALALDFGSFELGANESLVVYATPPQSAGKSFVKSEYRFLGAATIADDEADILTLYSNRLGSSIAEGTRVFIRCAIVSTVSGQQGVPLEGIGVFQ